MSGHVNGTNHRSAKPVVSVVGGGWSVGAVDLAQIPGDIIVGVNEAGVLLPKCNAVVSMDRLWSESRWPKLKSLKRDFYARRSALQNIDWMGDDWVYEFECDHQSTEFSEYKGTLNGTNSGMCALNLAYYMQPATLYLFGFDMCRSPQGKAYWHAPYPWAPPQGATKPKKYDAWALEFNDAALKFAAIGTRVINVSPDSKIHNFEKVSAKDLGIGS